ncbi:type II toxin-antitoxin system VapB family antitoxin [Marinobacter salsuginis]|nr:type II toxin-antitoxin system VapB family antitoxin [Marinobacter salsuginis]
MRTKILVDDQLMAEALDASGCGTINEAIEEGLKLLIRHSEQQEIRKLRGNIDWDGDLDEMRGTQ